MAEVATPIDTRRGLSPFQVAQLVLGVLFVLFVSWRLITVLVIEHKLGAETWVKLVISGLVIGSMYSLIAIGYTLVYGILRMINFAHSEVFMSGMYAGYFVFELLGAIIVDPSQKVAFINAFPIVSVMIAFAAGIGVSLLVGFSLERIAYRPLRRAPRLVPLISAIGASFFLQYSALRMFGSQKRVYHNPEILNRDFGWTIYLPSGKLLLFGSTISLPGGKILLTYTSVFTFLLAVALLIVLYTIVQRTKLGRAMRAVSEDKQTAALMGIDVDKVISQTFMISGALAGAGAVMWGIHYGSLGFFIGFIPGIKAFTAAVLGGIGNLPGAMLGAMLIGLIESVGPSILGFDLQLRDVIAFSILVLVLMFRPSGILGEVLSEEKV